MINNNLIPSFRIKKENLMILFLILKPNQPKNFYNHLLIKWKNSKVSILFKFTIIKNILIIFFILEEITYYDAYIKSEFILHAYIIA